MNLFATSCLIILLPLISQIILGTKSINKRIKLNFDLICIINMFVEIVFIFIAMKIVTFDAINQNVRCGMPQMAIVFFGIIVFIALLITIAIQLIIRKVRNRKFEIDKIE